MNDVLGGYCDLNCTLLCNCVHVLSFVDLSKIHCSCDDTCDTVFMCLSVLQDSVNRLMDQYMEV